MRPNLLAPALFLAALLLLQPGLAQADVASEIKTIATDLCGTFATICVTIGLVGAGAQFFSSQGDLPAVIRVIVPWAIAAAIALGATTLVSTFGFSS
jgi:type IV secretory pathway VirB2 component (pilin)